MKCLYCELLNTEEKKNYKRPETNPLICSDIARINIKMSMTPWKKYTFDVILINILMAFFTTTNKQKILNIHKNHKGPQTKLS